MELKGAEDGLYAAAATNGKDNAVLLANIGEEKEISLDLEGKYYAYAATDDTRMKPVALDAASFQMEKDTFVFLSTAEIHIPE